MAIYKGYEVNDDLYAVIRYMPHVQNQRDNLEQQQISWDYLSVMAQLANLDNELSSARKQFNYLTGVLLNDLGLESLKKVLNEYGAKAQVSINLLIRNLFERTADIGFLATDTAIRDYLSTPSLQNQQSTEALIKRFNAYVQKYSVYDNVILLDKTGHVLAQLDDKNPITKTKITDAAFKEALTTEEEYIESYGYSDLAPNKNKSLIYTYRVESEDRSEVLGVICLSFKLQNELTGIFDNLIEDQNNEVMVMLDAKYQVIASGREELVPLGSYVNLKEESTVETVFCNGREYLAFVRPAVAYQGYAGAGWMGCVLLPMNKAFKEEEPKHRLDEAVLTSAMAGDLFNEETKQIPVFANQIQKELNRSVWNGNVLQASEKNGSDAAVSKVLLSEIKNTGLNTKRIFEDSVNRIQKTVLGSVLKHSESSAALAIDVMDRNLYERANDCRWWALNNRIRTLLEKPELKEKDKKDIQSILTYINDLYTVYTNLIVFDTRGEVVAVSNSRYEELVGTVITSNWARAVMAQQNQQQYAVSAFEKTALYDGKPSYIFSAGIQSLDEQRTVGGIGIVFDSEPQFSAMLEAGLPVDSVGKVENNCFAVYTDADKNIIASSDAQYQVGSVLDVQDHFYKTQKGKSQSEIVEINGHYYAVGCAKSAGYREFKSESDAYQQEVYAFVMLHIGEKQQVKQTNKHEAVTNNNVLSTNQFKNQLASFYVGDDWLGFKSEKVVSAVSVDKLVPVCGKVDSMVAGTIIYKEKSVTMIHSAMLMGAKKPHFEEIAEAVIIKIGDDKMVALSIDGLGEMMDVDPAMIQPVGDEVSVTSKVITEVVLSNPQAPTDQMLQLMDVKLIEAVLTKVVTDADESVEETA